MKHGIWLIEFDGERRIDQFLAVPHTDGSFELKKLNEDRIMNLRGYGLFAELKDSVIWYKGKPGIVRHDLTKKSFDKSLNSTARISKVLSNSDSLLFGGYNHQLYLNFPIRTIRLRFQYASPSYYDEV